MLSQDKLNDKYPDSKIRIFENDFLESLTHVHPIVPLVLWIPIIGALFVVSQKANNHSVSDYVIWAFTGLIVWTLTEYVLHRFVFHFPAKSRAGKYFVFLFHGLHHDDAQDASRLVMPPVPALLIVGLLYLFFGMFIPAQYLKLFMGFFLIGYLCYDYIHYATHHFPMTSKVGRYLRSWHLKHHYSGEESKYGVSSPLWDYIFQTVTGPKKK